MDDDTSMDVNLTDLDLNQEPTDLSSPTVARTSSVFNELETVNERIEERIRQLEAVNARARQRQRWRQARHSIEVDHVSGETMVSRGGVSENSVGRAAEVGIGCKRDSSHLVAKALEMDFEVKKVDKEGGSFYDCNICLDIATDPILTCCGHLFCWACFYQVSYIDSNSKECPVCKGEVSDSTVVPIYGNGSSEGVQELDSGLKIPPRPKARRVESVRQQRVTQGLAHVPVAEALRRIRISIGAMGDQTQLDGGNTVIFNTESPERQNVEAGGGRRIRIHQVSRVLSESAASLSSLSSALSNAERLVEDLETVISNRFSRNELRASSIDVNNPLTRSSSVVQASNQPTDAARVIEAAFPGSSSPQTTDDAGSVLRIFAVRTSGEASLPVVPSAPSSSQRRRSAVPRPSNVDSRETRESRRRRLN